MEKTIDIDFSQPAKVIISETGYSQSDVIDFLIDAGGFSVGANEVVAFLQNKEK